MPYWNTISTSMLSPWQSCPHCSSHFCCQTTIPWMPHWDTFQSILKIWTLCGSFLPGLVNNHATRIPRICFKRWCQGGWLGFRWTILRSAFRWCAPVPWLQPSALQFHCLPSSWIRYWLNLLTFRSQLNPRQIHQIREC